MIIIMYKSLAEKQVTSIPMLLGVAGVGVCVGV